MHSRAPSWEGREEIFGRTMRGVRKEHHCAPRLSSGEEHNERWNVTNGRIGEEGAHQKISLGKAGANTSAA